MACEILPLGDAAVLVRCGERINAATSARVLGLADQLHSEVQPAFVAVVPAFTSLTVHYDPAQIDFARARELVANAESSAHPIQPERQATVEIPVCYEAEFAPDLAHVAQHCGLTAEQVIALHAGGEYFVGMIGFAPGFPYLGGMAAQLATPRRASPRVKVPAGAVGIGGAQTGIYPLEFPGGWQLIGRTPLRLFRSQANPLTLLLHAGDRVRLRRIGRDEFDALDHD